MGVKASAWAWEQPLSGNEKVILLAYADRARDDGVCWPGQESIAEKACVSVKTVQRVTAKLEEGGYLTRQKRFKPGGARTSDLAVLAMTKGQSDLRSNHADQRTPVSREPSVVEPSVEPHSPLSGEQIEMLPNSVETVHREWVSATKRDPARTKLTAKRKKVILTALKDYPLDDCLAAVRGIARSTWHSGENNRQERYDTIEVALRDAAHIERFRDMPEPEPEYAFGERLGI